ncbi:hypothetical protein DAEQUDRAFT_103935 [Daedalea quercina L-15889]|uniref:Uncharacterized protein n=1 Tax=Daedalea quercina L-15889 TaxID=1314783 RepID=A0A165KUX7_9APHY|nr:hypothetical protein DAEQUDRAFT_103935 [Daedalea quercina L-15889]
MLMSLHVFSHQCIILDQTSTLFAQPLLLTSTWCHASTVKMANSARIADSPMQLTIFRLYTTWHQVLCTLSLSSFF